MAGEPKTLSAGTSGIPSTREVRSLALAANFRRYFVWAQTIGVFLFLEFALWAPTTHIRNRWAVIAMFAILAFVLIDRPSLQRLGLRLPKAFGASVVLGVGFVTIGFMLMLVNWAGGQIPA